MSILHLFECVYGFLTKYVAYIILLVGVFRVEDSHWLLVNSQKRRLFPFGSCLWCCRIYNLRVGKDLISPIVQRNSQCCPQTGTSPQSLTGPWLNTGVESKYLETFLVFDIAVKTKHMILYYTKYQTTIDRKF